MVLEIKNGVLRVVHLKERKVVHAPRFSAWTTFREENPDDGQKIPWRRRRLTSSNQGHDVPTLETEDILNIWIP